MSDDETKREVRRRAEAMAAHVGVSGESFSTIRQAAGREYQDLLVAVSRLDARFGFDRDGRPGAVMAIREALPAVERELFDAVLDDHACEVAAVEEALYQLARVLCGETRQPL